MRPLSRQPVQLSATELIEASLRRGEGCLADNGALVVLTGKFTGRSPQDKYIVDDETTHGQVDWGPVNQPIGREQFDALYERVVDHLDSLEEVYAKDALACADPSYRLSVRVLSEYAWHSLFIDRLLIPAGSDAPDAEPGLTIIDAPGFAADPRRDGTRTSTFIILDMTRRLVLIGGTQYAGEIKKSVFSALNFLLPRRDVLPMHCSANAGADGRTALFFGLSGTGKTTLSADPERRLIGDDEHGWSDQGIFNFEGGCYAKCINLTAEKEPEIWDAIKFGTVLENVRLAESSRRAIYSDQSLTENSRAAYPLEYIPNALQPSVAGHPSCVIFLCADAFGVLPPISRLSKDQAMYYFLSGYTAKLAGTERGVTTPQATFSACFGAPFLPLAPTVYAQMLGARLQRHAASCYLVNTGWTGGGYAVGKRIDLATTRAIVSAALSGSLDDAEAACEPFFGLSVPTQIAGVPAQLLQPRAAWADSAAYDAQAIQLARRFADNFARFQDVAPAIAAAGPRG